MKSRIVVPALVVLFLWGGYLLLPSLAGAAPSSFLGDKHKSRGTDCSGCHKESPPKQNVPMAACLSCHGNYGKLSARTAKLDPNPHDSHLGAFECGKCHHAHKASENACAACHSIDLKVP